MAVFNIYKYAFLGRVRIVGVEQKKSKPMSLRIERSIAERLTDFCKRSGQSKTTAIERAIIAYIDNYDLIMEEINKFQK